MSPAGSGGGRGRGRDFSRRQVRRLVPAQPERRQPGEPGTGGCEHERPREPQQLDQDQPGRERPDDRAERVGGVQPAERPREVRVARELARQRRQRRAHEHRRRGEREHRQPEADEGERLGCRLEGAVRPAIDLVEQPERDRREQDDDDEDELDRAVQAKRGAHPVGEPPADDAADRHPAEEPGQDRRHRLGRVAEDEDELPGPDDLVHQPGGAGQDEDRQEESGMAHRRSVPSCDGPRATPRDQPSCGSAVVGP